MLESALNSSLLAIVSLPVESFNGKAMPAVRFLIDTGATCLTIPEKIVLKTLKFDKDWVAENKVELPEGEKIETAAGDSKDFYFLPAPRVNVGGAEFKLPYMLVNKNERPHALFGMAALQHFHFMYDFRSSPDFKFGKIRLEFRKESYKPFVNLQEAFAHELVVESSALLSYIRSVGGIKIKSLSPTEQYWMSCSDFRVDINELNTLVKAGKVVVRDGCYIPV